MLTILMSLGLFQFGDMDWVKPAKVHFNREDPGALPGNQERENTERDLGHSSKESVSFLSSLYL